MAAANGAARFRRRAGWLAVLPCLFASGCLDILLASGGCAYLARDAFMTGGILMIAFWIVIAVLAFLSGYWKR